MILYSYALDVNVDRAEDVLTHKRLLHLAKDPANRPVFEVRVVQASTRHYGKGLYFQIQPLFILCFLKRSLVGNSQ